MFKCYWLLQFNVIPFGLKGAPATFQRLMDRVVRGLDYTGAYLGDLVIFSDSWEEHLTHLRCSPTTDLTKKSHPNKVTWNAECDHAFKEVKRIHSSKPVLRSPDFKRPFILQTDASDKGVGAVLSQKADGGEEHSVAYWSRKLLPREQQYSTIEKECLAIKLAVEAFQVYLLGQPFTVETDHHALVWMDRLKTSNVRLACWSLALQPFEFTMVHRPGKENANADAMS